MEGKLALPVTLVTGRTIDQGVGKERGKTSKEYMDNVSVCFLDPRDLAKLGIKEKTNVLISTEYGSVVVQALKSLRAPHAGIVYVPYGPWANTIVNPETNSIGMPSFKGIPARIEAVSEECVLTLPELLKKQFQKEPP
jgi:formylmethanofuran dehydrogenase subunit D